MKHHCSLTIPRALAFAGLSTIGLALAGGEPTPTERFNTADVDVSSTLSSAEFATTFSTPLSKGQLKKEFRDADTDGNGSIVLSEWLGYLRDEVLRDPNATPTEKFEVVDGDADGSITLEEFALLVPGKKALIEKRKRFLMADADDDDLVTLEEYLDYVESPQPDTSGIPFLKFDLADLDANDELTIDEFANAYPPAVKPQVIAKKFSGKDANDDDVLTRDEWNPGGQSGAP